VRPVGKPYPECRVNAARPFQGWDQARVAASTSGLTVAAGLVALDRVQCSLESSAGAANRVIRN